VTGVGSAGANRRRGGRDIGQAFGDDIVKIIEQWRTALLPAPADAPDEVLASGAFSRRSRLSPKALRLYDEMGLLSPDRVDPATGYRSYRASQLPTARLISALRRLDMPLATIAEVVAAPRGQAAGLLAAYWDDFEARVATQRELVAHIRRRLRYDEQESDLLRQVRSRDVPRQVVLTERRHVPQQDLVPFLEEALPRGIEIASRDLGGVVGAPFAVFHGEVSYESSGPVEVCVPVDAACQGRRDHPIRVEDAHAEAYLRVRKAQVGHPQILSAYDAVAAWIHANNRFVGGAPREIYFAADFPKAAPGDEVCDVAFPMRGPI
jgi:DNA-binding transcriptional MerR regulator